MSVPVKGFLAALIVAVVLVVGSCGSHQHASSPPTPNFCDADGCVYEPGLDDSGRPQPGGGYGAGGSWVTP